MRTILLAVLLCMAAPATAQKFWIPAEKFDLYTSAALEGSLTVDDDTGRQVYLLRSDEQVRLKIGLQDDLTRFLNQYPEFKVCSYVANYDDGVSNTVLARHPNADRNRTKTVRDSDYRVVCSERGSINANNIVTGGVKLLSPSQGVLKVRGLLVRSTETDGSDYEYARALGYLFGDGSLSSDGRTLNYPKKDSSTSNHFGSVSREAFGSDLSVNSQGSRYIVELDGISPSKFLFDGMSLSDIPDKHAFITSLVETEGAVLVARILDDPNRSRCRYARDIFNSINPQCSANTCTDSSCATPNCAFIAHGKYRYRPDVPSVNSHCGVYLSGDDSDWRALFRSSDFHFVKTDRTPGGEPTRHGPYSRPDF